jgi:2-polyprenyl-3-methyl-5-hydroxy-6-metoxy-1,4-benzoquinol methylase
MKAKAATCICGGTQFTSVFHYDSPPAGEVRFQFSSGSDYRREVLRCEVCGHFVSRHQMNGNVRYTGDYVNATYGDDGGLRRTFERIIALAPEKSDNVGRVRRILEFAAAHRSGSAAAGRAPSVLDVGSGLCVFLHRMKTAGWECTALDPDPRAVAHAQSIVGVRALCADFMEVNALGRFDLVTFNKVLEHVVAPTAMLAKACACVAPSGFVYVEVPDGEAAVVEGPEREEFFIDHLHVFSAASLALLATQAGFTVRALERLREPSSKFTLRAFLVAGR